MIFTKTLTFFWMCVGNDFNNRSNFLPITEKIFSEITIILIFVFCVHKNIFNKRKFSKDFTDNIRIICTQKITRYAALSPSQLQLHVEALLCERFNQASNFTCYLKKV